jgi:hypothetical protein
MPTWNLNYQIGRDCTLEDFHREQQVFRSDPQCVSYQYNQRSTEPLLIQAQVVFNESMSGESLRILQLRTYPRYRQTRLPRHEVQMSTEGFQEGQLVIGAPVSIDENGRLGTHGTPIGIISQVDWDNHQARIIFEPEMRMGVYRNPVRFSREELEVTRIQLDRRPFPLQNPVVQQMRQQIMAEEDARVLEALDTIAQEAPPRQPRPKKAKPAPEPRPTFKTRYERIMDALKGK